MQDRGLDPETRLVGGAARSRPASTSPRRSGSRPGSPTLYVERLRIAGGEPLLLEQVHLPAERFPGLLASDLEHGSLYDLLTVRYGTRIVRARESLEPVLLHTREARLLGQPAAGAGPPDRGHRVHAPTASPVEFARSYVRGDRTRYYIERVVVRSSWQTDDRRRRSRPAARPARRPQPAADHRHRRRPTAGATPG